MKKVVITTLNSKYIHASLAPWCLLSGVEQFSKTDVTAKVVEGTVNEDLGAVCERILKEKPDIVGFCCYIWNIEKTIELLNMLKSKINFTAVFGGPEVGFRQADVLENYSNVDFVLSGEGEYPFAKLVDILNTNGDLCDVEGLSYINGDNIVIKPPYYHNVELISPYTDEFFSALKGRIAYLETSRGCPYSCAFCLSGSDSFYRSFSINKAKENILKLANSGSKTIKLVDRTFNADKTRCKELLNFIAKHYGNEIPLGVCFHFEIAGDILDSETIEIINSAQKGSIQLEIGMQSFNEKTLAAVNRKTNTKKLKENITALVSKRNVHIHIDLIAGLPFEGIDSFKQSFNTAFWLSADMLQLGFLKLLYGSPMRLNPNVYPCEYNKKAPYEVIKTPWLNRTEISALKSLENANELICNSGRFQNTKKYLFSVLKLDPFDSLCAFGQFLGTNSHPLRTTINAVYNFFGEFTDKAVLRDCLLLDLFSSSCPEQIPSLLRIEDKRLKQFKKYVGIEKGIKRKCFLLYSKSCGGYVDYTEQNKENGKHKITLIPFSKFM